MRAYAIIAAVCLSACSGERTESPSAPAASPSSASVPAAPAAVASVASDDPAVYRGAALARQVCTRCHDVGAGAPPAEQVGAPDFGDLATHGLSTQEEMTAASLAAWMRASHPAMPNYMLGEADIADLAAYIVSLRPAN